MTVQRVRLFIKNRLSILIMLLLPSFQFASAYYEIVATLDNEELFEIIERIKTYSLTVRGGYAHNSEVLTPEGNLMLGDFDYRNPDPEATRMPALIIHPPVELAAEGECQILISTTSIAEGLILMNIEALFELM